MICQVCKLKLELKFELEEKERKERKRLKFQQVWRSGNIEQKLNCYGLKKLRILAKRKGIEYSQVEKDTLIKDLTSVTTHDDFPIKE